MNPSGNVQFVYVVGDILPEEIDDSTIYIVGTEKKSIYVGSELIASDLTGDIDHIEEQIGNNTLGTSVPKYDVEFTDHTYSASNGSTDGTITVTQEAIYAPNDTGEHHQQIPAVSFTPKVGGWDELVASIPKGYYTQSMNLGLGNVCSSDVSNYNVLSASFNNNNNASNPIIANVSFYGNVTSYDGTANIRIDAYVGNLRVYSTTIPVTSTGSVQLNEMAFYVATQITTDAISYLQITPYNCSCNNCRGGIMFMAGNITENTNYIVINDFDEWTITGNAECSYNEDYGGWVITTTNSVPSTCKLTKTFSVEENTSYELIIDTMFCEGVTGYAEIYMQDLYVGATSWPHTIVNATNQGGFSTLLTTDEDTQEMSITIDLSNVSTSDTAMFLLNKMYLV